MPHSVSFQGTKLVIVSAAAPRAMPTWLPPRCVTRNGAMALLRDLHSSFARAPLSAQSSLLGDNLKQLTWMLLDTGIPRCFRGRSLTLRVGFVGGRGDRGTTRQTGLHRHTRTCSSKRLWNPSAEIYSVPLSWSPRLRPFIAAGGWAECESESRPRWDLCRHNSQHTRSQGKLELAQGKLGTGQPE